MALYNCWECGCAFHAEDIEGCKICPACYDEQFDASEFDNDDSDMMDYDEDDNDGQPDEYTEWQDYMGGDDWDQGQYDNDF